MINESDSIFISIKFVNILLVFFAKIKITVYYFDRYLKLANWAPALPGKNLMSLRLLEFGVPWGPGVGLVRLCLC